MSTFHKGFKDDKGKVKEIFLDINITLLIPSIANPAYKEKASGVQANTSAPIEVPPSVTPEVATIDEVPKMSNQKLQLIKRWKYEGFIFLYYILFFLFSTFVFLTGSLRTLYFVNIFEAIKSIFLNQCFLFSISLTF